MSQTYIVQHLVQEKLLLRVSYTTNNTYSVFTLDMSTLY